MTTTKKEVIKTTKGKQAGRKKGKKGVKDTLWGLLKEMKVVKTERKEKKDSKKNKKKTGGNLGLFTVMTEKNMKDIITDAKNSISSSTMEL